MTAAPLPDALAQKPRMASIDMMRGLVMVIMALDHARDFFHADAFVFDPTDLERTSPVLFFTRIITHFCAPTFVLLAGTAVRISSQRKSPRELSVFLLTRGAWLVLLEVTVVRFSMVFQWYYDVIIFQVIWAIGISMVIMAALIHLTPRVLLGVGLLITFAHDLLHAVTPEPGQPEAILWTFVHQFSFIALTPDHAAFVPYPFLPWLGIMILGYCLGEWYLKTFDPARRRRLLIRTGLSAIALFLVLRTFNLYGDPAPWSVQHNAVFTLMSFLNVTKYPVSLHYTLATLGPVLLLLAWMEKLDEAAFRPWVIIGRVPLFYYVLHFYLLHLAALALYMADTGKGLSEIDFHFSAGFGGLPRGYGYPLIGAYLAWIAVVMLLYPACRWYNRYKATHHYRWLSYL